MPGYFKWVCAMDGMEANVPGFVSAHRIKGRPHYYSSRKEEYAQVRFDLDAGTSLALSHSHFSDICVYANCLLKTSPPSSTGTQNNSSSTSSRHIRPPKTQPPCAPPNPSSGTPSSQPPNRRIPSPPCETAISPARRQRRSLSAVFRRRTRAQTGIPARIGIRLRARIRMKLPASCVCAISARSIRSGTSRGKWRRDQVSRWLSAGMCSRGLGRCGGVLGPGRCRIRRERSRGVR